jgi:hypothetical protein
MGNHHDHNPQVPLVEDTRADVRKLLSGVTPAPVGES